MKKFLIGLLCCGMCLNSVGILAGTVHAQQPEQSLQEAPIPEPEAQPAAAGLSTVYVSSQGSDDASGADRDHPVRDLNRAIELAAMYGHIVILGDMEVENMTFPKDKQLFFDGDPASRATVTLKGDTNFRTLTYINGLDLHFLGDVFLNNQFVEMKETAILGKPDFYLGFKQAPDQDNGDKGELKIQNETVQSDPVGNIYIGSYGGNEINTGSVELYNISVEGVIDGTHAASRSYAYFGGDVTVPVVKNVDKVIFADNSNVHITDGLENTLELYVDRSTLTLSEHAQVSAHMIYGDAALDFSGGIAKTPYINYKRFSGKFTLAQHLTDRGYRIHPIESGNEVFLAVWDQPDHPQGTNFAPNIRVYPRELVIREGFTADLKKGAEAWDYEDGPLTDAIVYPTEDVSKLPIGVHQLVYRVQDKQGNVTEFVRDVHIIANASPVFVRIENVQVKAKDAETFDLMEGIVVKDDKDEHVTVETTDTIHKPAPDTEETFVIRYRAVDTNGNETFASREIFVSNYTPKFDGLTDLTVYKGGAVDYLSGISVTDTEDGPITRITVEQKIDTAQPGEQQAVYSVTDSDGNVVKAVRNITVKNTVDWVELQPAQPVEPPVPEPPVPEPPVPEPPVPEPPVPEPPVPEPPVPKPPVPDITFTDVPEDSWYAKSVKWAVARGITFGTGDGEFSPELTCTRAEAVTFLWRAAGRPNPTSSANPFTDVDLDSWYGKAVLWAVETGITKGTSDTTFSPDESCERRQVVAFLWRAAGRPEPASAANPFTDVDLDSWYGKAVLWAVANGITEGTGEGRFSPEDSCDRAQIVAFLHRADKL